MQPRQPVLLTFGIVRPLGGETMAGLATRVGPTLGCVLREQEERDGAYHAATLLGMQVELRQWHSPPRALAFLRGFRPFGDPAAAELDIGEAVLDLLNQAGLGPWRNVTQEDIQEPGQFIAEVDR